MSFTRNITIWCDRCEDGGTFYDSLCGTDDPEEAREEAKEIGWVHTAEGKDLCPECAEDILNKTKRT